MNLWRRCFPSPLLEWDEPVGFLRSWRPRRRTRLSRLLLALAAVGFAFGWALSRVYPGLEATGIHAAAGSLAFIALLSLWAHTATTSRIRIFDRDIRQTSGDDTASVWEFKDIDHCEILANTVGDDTHSVLVVELRRGKRITIGVDSSVDPDALRAALDRCEVPVTLQRREIRPPAHPSENGEA